MEPESVEITDDRRKDWTPPRLILSEIRDVVTNTFKSNPSWVDYLTGISHVGGS
jgi:hypothetical protein